MSSYLSIIWIVAAVAAPPTGTQQPQQQPAATTADQKASQPKKPDLAGKLPEPLSWITGNIGDLEKTGYFKIVDARYGKTKGLSEPAVIWTIEIVKPITCRHAILLLNHLKDVRFYSLVDEKYQQLLLLSEMYYSPWLEEGAVNNEILDRDERFQVWVLLDENQIWVLKHDRADSVVFANPKEPRPGRKNLWRQTRKYRSPSAHFTLDNRPVGSH